MARNAQLDAPIAGDAATLQGYHSHMEGKIPLRQNEAPAPISLPPPPPQWPPYYPPPPKPARRWLPLAIITAAIVIAAGLVSAALIVNRGNPTAAPPNFTAPAATSGAASTVNSSTCKAWPGTQAAVLAIPQLPPGWDWDTPNIDTYIGNRTAAIAKALDLFEPTISAEPADVADAAHDYVAEQRKSIQMLKAHTYTQADGVGIDMAAGRLDQLCGA